MKRSWTSAALATLLTVPLASPAWSSPGPARPALDDAPGIVTPGSRGAPSGPDAFHPRRGQPLHVALGDSVPAGQQSVPAVDDFPTTMELWKANGFVARFHAALRQRLDCTPGRGRHDGTGCPGLGLVNLARPGIPGGPGGVTTATVLEPGDQLDQAVALIASRHRDRSPRDDVQVVTVSVGGNDLYGPAVQGCVLTTDTCVATLEATFAGFAERYDRILRTLREAAGPDTLILTMTYYNPLPYCFLGAADPAGAKAAGDVILEGGELAPGVVVPRGFNDVLREVAGRHDVTVVEAFGLLDGDDLVGGTDCTHPDGTGHRTLAKAFTAALPAPRS